MAVSMRTLTPSPLARWLATKSARERRTLGIVAVLILIALAWAVIWQPLVRDTRAMRMSRSSDQAALAAARRMTDEMVGLARGVLPPVPPDARAALERVLVAQNLRGAVTQLDWQQNRARVVFAAVPYDPLIAALEALQRDAQLRAVEAAITASVEPGIVRAELTLTR